MPLKTCAACGAPFKPTQYRQTKCAKHHVSGRAGRSPTTRAQDAEYYRERARILRGRPPCALRIHCDGAPATTADHIVPVSRGGGHRGNLQPACAKCNAAKGNRST